MDAQFETEQLFVLQKILKMNPIKAIQGELSIFYD